MNQWTLLSLALAILLFTAPAAAQVRYKDDEGVVHWVNSINEVPEKYRGNASGTAVTPRPPGSAPAINWEQQARDAEQRRAQETQNTLRQQAAQEAGERQREAQEQANQKWTRDVTNCTDVARASGVFGADRFSAYVSGPGRVQMVGSAQARFSFQRCMTDAGHALE